MSKIEQFRLILKNYGLAYGGGIITGILAWLFGASSLPVLMLKHGSSLSYVFVIAVMLASLSQLRCWYIGQPLDLFAKSISMRTVSGASKAAVFMSGACSTALICWLITGNLNALGFMLYGSLFISALTYFSWIINWGLQKHAE